MNNIKNLYIKYREIITYLIAGFATTVVSWGAYSLCVTALPVTGEDLKISIANIISWICSILFAYIINKLWVFRSLSFKRSYIIKEFVRFISARLATGILEIVGVPLLVKLGLNQTILGIEGMVSKVVVSVAVVVLNYIFSKLLIFKNDK